MRLRTRTVELRVLRLPNDYLEIDHSQSAKGPSQQRKLEPTLPAPRDSGEPVCAPRTGDASGCNGSKADSSDLAAGTGGKWTSRTLFSCEFRVSTTKAFPCLPVSNFGTDPRCKILEKLREAAHVCQLVRDGSLMPAKLGSEFRSRPQRCRCFRSFVAC